MPDDASRLPPEGVPRTPSAQHRRARDQLLAAGVAEGLLRGDVSGRIALRDNGHGGHVARGPTSHDVFPEQITPDLNSADFAEQSSLIN
ncbi:hypothetical protein G3I40_09925 [Streptomyces sp. SID14478]|uniref:hypothetical protein n=1 Tax=Streptomyces sp. SID14478 TaxID=2706073 RepID=UPI0013DB3694|nr:hypothetical protein [Streptomyces sp. SID14478]NEB75540.1 hypothetical protein [Streptomyces sp. SID14478]